MAGLTGNLMNKYLIIMLTFLFFSCNSNLKNNTSELKTSMVGIGIGYDFSNDGYIKITSIKENSPAYKARINNQLRKNDIVIAIKKNDSLFISTKEKSYEELKNIFKGNPGDSIHLQLIRKKNNKIIKEWSITLTISHFMFTGYDLKEAKYFFNKDKDNSVFHETHPTGFYNKTAKGYGEKYFNIYLQERPSKIADDAIRYAFFNWMNSSSVDETNIALKKIANHDIWYEIYSFILTVQYKTDDKKIISEGVDLLENLCKNTTSRNAETVLLYTLGKYYFNENDKIKASVYLKKLIKINDNTWYTNSSKKYLNDINNLNIGQRAPDFCINDIDSNEICSDKLRGKYILLHFWSPYCGFSRNEMDYLKNVYEKFNKFDNFFMIGVAVNRNEAMIKVEIKKKNFSWPQVLQNFEVKNNLLDQYSIHGVPDMYLIDTEGKIIYKDLRGDNLMIKFDELFLKN